MKKIFVGNLPWKVTEDELKTLFEGIFEEPGTVQSVKIIVDQYTGKSKGFAFVEMADAQHAEHAIRTLNDQPFMERNLRVSIANDRPERSGGGGERREYRGSGAGAGRGGRDGERSYRSSSQRSY